MAADLPTQVPTPDTTPASSSLLYIVDDPYGTPADNATTLANGVTKGHGLSDGAVTSVVSGVMDTSAVTSSAAELNILDGATLSTTELNYVDGVTSAIQTQIDAKAPLASPTFTGTVTLPVGLTGVIRTDTGVVSVDSDVTDIVAAASDTAAGKVELATTAETTTGTDATRAVTPDGLHDMTSLSGAAWFLDEDNMVSDSATKTVSQQSVKAYTDGKVSDTAYGAGWNGDTTTAPSKNAVYDKIETLGGSNLTVVSKTSADSPYSILTSDALVLYDASGGNSTATLPTAVGVTGKVYYIKRTDSTIANTLTVATTSSQTIDGSTTIILRTQYNTLAVVSDGANWQIL